MQTLSQTLTRAAEILDASGSRSHYARCVLKGYQAWSGADLKGKARKYGASYAEQRRKAASALHAAGGSLHYCGRSGKLSPAVRLCVDDYGNAIYDVGLSRPRLAIARGKAGRLYVL